jgi:ABC-2 type transport system permease protein
MSVAVMRKTARDALLLLVIAVLAILIFECLLVRALGEFADEITEVWFRLAFLKNLVNALVGADLAENVTATSLVTIGFSHPLLYAFVWGFLLTTCTRIIAGEIDRGTADLLLSLPLSRARVYASISVAWMLGGMLICAAPLVGIWLGELASPMSEPLKLSRLRTAPVNLFALYLAIGCGTMLVSSLVARRGTAIAVVLATLLASFLLSFLAQFWPIARHISFLGVLDYYRPLETVRTGKWPITEITVLCTSAIVLWLGGLWHFSRRDIPAA